MIQIETMEFAPAFIKEIAEEFVGTPKAFAKIRMYDAAPAAKYPELRDRTEDCYKMLRGLVGNLKAPINFFDFTGRELVEYGCDYIAGSAFIQNYRLIFV